jgi:hypothetical protein
VGGAQRTKENGTLGPPEHEREHERERVLVFGRLILEPFPHSLPGAEEQIEIVRRAV